MYLCKFKIEHSIVLARSKHAFLCEWARDLAQSIVFADTFLQEHPEIYGLSCRRFVYKHVIRLEDLLK